MLSSKPVDQRLAVLPPKSQACRARVRPALTVLVTLAAAVVFMVALKGKSASFSAALHTAPLGLLGLAAALQLLALLSRTEAWNVSVRAAGGATTTPSASTPCCPTRWRAIRTSATCSACSPDG